MSHDENGDTPIEAVRRQMTDEINRDPAQTREEAEARYGKVWDTEELQRDFEVHSFAAPFCLVTAKDTGKHGLLTFQHRPRWYFVGA